LNRFSYLKFPASVFLVWALLSGSSNADDSLWSVLDREGDALDLMAIESEGKRVLLVGAKYEELQWRAEDEPPPEMVILPKIRKQLHIISIDSNETVEWQHSFPAVPDVSEIYSAKVTPDNHMCIAYGQNYESDEFINPVVLQVDAGGKIIWADSNAIAESYLPEKVSNEYFQIANLESIRVVDSDDNGCVVSYVLRHQTATTETYQLNVFKIDKEGNHKWRFSHSTDLYGKMFLVRDRDANHYTVVQTNQSRDAAIEAMMAARPFRPLTNIIIISHDGKLEHFHPHDQLKDFDRVWVKHMVDAPGGSVLLVGNLKNAWAALVDKQGVLKKVYSTQEGEFGFVNRKPPDGFVMVRGDAIELVDKDLNMQIDKPIEAVIKKKYINAYMEKQLSEEGPIQNIVPLRKDAYLILYKLGSRLKKIEF